MFAWFRRRRRAKVRKRPFPLEWKQLIEEHVPYYSRLPGEDQRELLEHIHVFLEEKHFEGCGDLEIDDTIRLTVAAHACILLLHRDTDYYPGLTSILVYPSHFTVERTDCVGGGLRVVEDKILAGEAWQQGVVILAWDGVLKSARRDHDGYNVAFHEFAHQLDMENGAADGFPGIHDRELRQRWGEVCTHEYERLVRATERRRRMLMDDYGAENPAEFFAVATETFFERPRKMKDKHDHLYDVLRDFYQQDPAPLFAPGRR